jgi:superfamily II DNA or RNA helicase
MINSTNYPSELADTLAEYASIEDPSKLFDYQKNVFNFMTKMDQRGILLYHEVGSGKCMAIDSPVMMSDGRIKKVQNIKRGETLMGDDSSPRKVLSLARGVDYMYNIWYGPNKYTVNQEHILCLMTDNYPLTWKSGSFTMVKFLEDGNPRVKIFVNADQEEVNLFMDQHQEKILCIPVKDYIKSPELSNAKGYKAKVYFESKPVSNSPFLVGTLHGKSGNPLPNEYVINSHMIRQYVVAGILGSGWLYNRKQCRDAPYDSYLITFTRTKFKLMRQFTFMLNTMGILHSVKTRSNVCRIVLYGAELAKIHEKTMYSDFDFVPSKETIDSGYKISVKPIGMGNYFGFTLDGNRRYLLGDCTVTHNTMTSVSIAEFFKELGKDILVLSSKSLQINYKKEIQKFREDDNLEGYNFITSGARNMISKLTGSDAKNSLDEVLTQMNKKNLDSKVIIIDEAHNLFNSIANGSEIANEFYDMVINAKNIKIILMTGTPIVNDPFELAICFNMIAGNLSNTGNKSRADRLTLLPEHYTDFTKFFTKSNEIVNAGKLKNRIFGLTSYYGDFYQRQINLTQDLKTTLSKENYPDRLPVKFEVVKMTELQGQNYMKARERERAERAGAGVYKEASTSSTSYRIKSRQISNVYFDSEGEMHSSKINRLIENIQKVSEEEGSILVYSTFLEYGVEAVAKRLTISHAIFSGKQNEEEKTQILADFNSGKIKILLITKSGTEGLDLKNVRHLHIMEPYWNFSLIQQVIARGVRYKSHASLDPSLRNVQVYIYLSDYNDADLSAIKARERTEKIEKTTDIQLFTNALKNQEMIYKFLKLIASTSIECKFFNKGNNYECYTCQKTGQKMFIEDIYTDMKMSNNCKQSKQVEAHELIIDDIKYYATDENVYRLVNGTAVLVHDPEVIEAAMSSKNKQKTTLL